MAELHRKRLVVVIVIISAVIALYGLFQISVKNKDKVWITDTDNTDVQSISRGKALFKSKCSFCHNTYSTETRTGPGLQGILKRDRLPHTGRPATPENIILQLKEPADRMPSFAYLSEEEISDVLAYLRTL